jgi:hypothetical protein
MVVVVVVVVVVLVVVVVAVVEDVMLVQFGYDPTMVPFGKQVQVVGLPTYSDPHATSHVAFATVPAQFVVLYSKPVGKLS